MINNSAMNCSISLKFGTDFYHMTPYLQQGSRSSGKRSRSRSQRDLTC